MSRDTSLTFREAVFSQETVEAFIVLIEIDHADLSAPIRVCSNSENITSNGNLYVALPFRLSLPDDQADQFTRARLEIDNVDRSIVESLRLIDTAPTVSLSVVLASDPDTVEVTFPNLILRKANYDVMTVSGNVSLTTFMEEPFPGDTFLPSTVPGVF